MVDEFDMPDQKPLSTSSVPRIFESGATRNSENGKYDYEGFLSPLVLQRYGEFMHKHRLRQDGSLRAADNWQKGMAKSVYIKSAFRHFMDMWLHHRGFSKLAVEELEESLCAVLFNIMGFLHEHLKTHLDEKL